MKTELVDVSPTRKEIKIEIEPAQIRTAYDRISERYAKGASVPGFRRGHAPDLWFALVLSNRSDVLRELCPTPLTQPSVSIHSQQSANDVHLDNIEAWKILAKNQSP
jgi:FKBP-type peptidyl-prolyl cis-trans isomerase (trigger factor)